MAIEGIAQGEGAAPSAGDPATCAEEQQGIEGQGAARAVTVANRDKPSNPTSGLPPRNSTAGQGRDVRMTESCDVAVAEANLAGEGVEEGHKAESAYWEPEEEH